MIASFVEGRIRLRDEKLKNSAVVDEIQKRAAQLKGISDVSINQRTGSLLIFYDKAVLRLEQVLHILADYLDAAKTEWGLSQNYGHSPRIQRGRLRFGTVPVAGPFFCRKFVKLGMLASLAVSMLGAAAGIAALHITAGIIFLGFVGLHIL
jgi:hypothetical protein